MRTYQGDFVIDLPRQTVWEFVMDPQRVGPCVPDLLKLDVESETRFHTLVRVGVGPVRGKFNLTVEVAVTEPEESAELSVRGGGMGSRVDMKAKLNLSDTESGGTKLDWRCDAAISGPIASLGGRMIDNEARKITEKLFANLREALSSVSEQVAATSTETAEPESTD
ncbi:CoxG family protein [Polycladomyces subterraneus]|uniref:Carbon monoxide dehydrogenase subunit G n=1 Tax=Polycladomyces subterraneus TaxID=1016997 RepID=A0ABT8INS1_9BACL|nr:carbon monoxide dehydrogenase subunit G [Polycladomyces subterraneus]MDN4594181.1 carbon monoxide dehydrogenase subunit G [Polycladomyces subterraneus]